MNLTKKRATNNKQSIHRNTEVEKKKLNEEEEKKSESNEKQDHQLWRIYKRLRKQRLTPTRHWATTWKTTWTLFKRLIRNRTITYTQMHFIVVGLSVLPYLSALLSFSPLSRCVWFFSFFLILHIRTIRRIFPSIRVWLFKCCGDSKSKLEKSHYAERNVCIEICVLKSLIIDTH